MKRIKYILLAVFISVNVNAQFLEKRLDCISLIQSEGGLYEISVEVDNLPEIPFVLDSGCSEVTMPAYIIYTLIKMGKVTTEDVLEDRTYMVADGNLMTTRRFIVKQLKIGNHIIKNVEVSMSLNTASPPLLGHNVLKQLGVVVVNYKTHTLCVELE